MTAKKSIGSRAPYTRSVMYAVLAFVAAAGGYGGYYVTRQEPTGGHLGDEYETDLYVVSRVLDGDTIELDDGAKVRLLGINAPELGQCYGAESAQALSSLVLGREVMLQKDSTAIDEFDRLLRYVFLYNPDAEKDNIFVNNYMVREGYAISNNRGADRRYERLLNNSMGMAKSDGYGWHSACTKDDDYIEPFREDCLIKGNNDYGTSSDIYYTPDCYAYTRVYLRWSDGDRYFCTVEEALSAGYRPAKNCPQ
ncbi:MAG: thermonuclease family protein [Patescibacteria group bacterium]